MPEAVALAPVAHGRRAGGQGTPRRRPRFSRHLEAPLRRAFAVHPVVAVLGMRGAGKSTLVRHLARGGGFAYFDLEEEEHQAAARAAPESFVTRAGEPAVFDGVEHAPEVLPALKARLGYDPRPGRYLLTASVNVLRAATVVATLGPWARVLRLHPLSSQEVLGRDPWPLLDRLLLARRTTDLEATLPSEWDDVDIDSLIRRGGLPAAALLTQDSYRAAWCERYWARFLTDGLAPLGVARKDAGRVHVLGRRLAEYNGRRRNHSAMGREMHLSLQEVRKYLDLFVAAFQLETLPGLLPGYRSTASQVRRPAPKLYMTDPGLAHHLGGYPAGSARGPENVPGAEPWPVLLRTWVASEVRKLAALHQVPTALGYWPAGLSREVDFVVESAQGVLGLVVCTRADRRTDALLQLARLRSRARERWHLGVVFYEGTQVLIEDDTRISLPFQALCGP